MDTLFTHLEQTPNKSCAAHLVATRRRSGPDLSSIGSVCSATSLLARSDGLTYRDRWSESSTGEVRQPGPPKD